MYSMKKLFVTPNGKIGESLISSSSEGEKAKRAKMAAIKQEIKIEPIVPTMLKTVDVPPLEPIDMETDEAQVPPPSPQPFPVPLNHPEQVPVPTQKTTVVKQTMTKSVEKTVIQSSSSLKAPDQVPVPVNILQPKKKVKTTAPPSTPVVEGETGHDRFLRDVDAIAEKYTAIAKKAEQAKKVAADPTSVPAPKALDKVVEIGKLVDPQFVAQQSTKTTVTKTSTVEITTKESAPKQTWPWWVPRASAVMIEHAAWASLNESLRPSEIPNTSNGGLLADIYDLAQLIMGHEQIIRESIQGLVTFLELKEEGPALFFASQLMILQHQKAYSVPDGVDMSKIACVGDLKETMKMEDMISPEGLIWATLILTSIKKGLDEFLSILKTWYSANENQEQRRETIMKSVIVYCRTPYSLQRYDGDQCIDETLKLEGKPFWNPWASKINTFKSHLRGRYNCQGKKEISPVIEGVFNERMLGKAPPSKEAEKHGKSKEKKDGKENEEKKEKKGKKEKKDKSESEEKSSKKEKKVAQKEQSNCNNDEAPKQKKKAEKPKAEKPKKIIDFSQFAAPAQVPMGESVLEIQQAKLAKAPIVAKSGMQIVPLVQDPLSDPKILCVPIKRGKTCFFPTQGENKGKMFMGPWKVSSTGLGRYLRNLELMKAMEVNSVVNHDGKMYQATSGIYLCFESVLERPIPESPAFKEGKINGELKRVVNTRSLGFALLSDVESVILEGDFVSKVTPVVLGLCAAAILRIPVLFSHIWLFEKKTLLVPSDQTLPDLDPKEKLFITRLLVLTGKPENPDYLAESNIYASILNSKNVLKGKMDSYKDRFYDDDSSLSKILKRWKVNDSESLSVASALLALGIEGASQGSLESYRSLAASQAPVQHKNLKRKRQTHDDGVDGEDIEESEEDDQERDPEADSDDQDAIVEDGVEEYESENQDQ